MDVKHRISLRSIAIEGSGFKMTSLTTNDPSAPVIMISGSPMTSENAKEKKIDSKGGNRIWMNEISKIEAWNSRVQKYLKEVKLRLLEEEKAL